MGNCREHNYSGDQSLGYGLKVEMIRSSFWGKKKETKRARLIMRSLAENSD